MIPFSFNASSIRVWLERAVIAVLVLCIGAELVYWFRHRAVPGADVSAPEWVEQDILPLNVIAKGLDKFPGIKRCGDNLRTAMSYVIDIALLIGGILAAQAIMPTTGLFIIVAFWCINKCSKKPLVSMAVGPLGAILVGLIANVLFLLSLYTPAA